MSNQRVLISGTNGQLGSEFCAYFEEHGIAYRGLTREYGDITDAKLVRKIAQDFKPTLVIHCAAYVNVDTAEDNRDECYNINVVGTENMVSICKERNIPLLFFSTDYIFSGGGERYHETEDEAKPVNWYGQTKLLAEKLVAEQLNAYYTVRISWVFGKFGNNFVKKIIKLANANDTINVVSDHYGTPTYTKDLVAFCMFLLTTEKFGTYHFTNGGLCSWFEFASSIVEIKEIVCDVKPILSKEYPSRGERPLNSRLSKKKIDDLNYRIRDWKDALVEALEEGLE